MRFFFCLKDFQCLGSVGRSDAHLEENLVHLLGSGGVNLAVGDEDASERRHGVAGQGVFPRFHQVVARSQAAGVIVLEDGKRRVGELGDEAAGGVDVEQVIVRNLLAVELVEESAEVAEELALLVRVLAVAHRLCVVDGDAQGRRLLLLAVEIVEDAAVIFARHGKRLLGKPAALGQGRFRALLGEQVGQRLILLFRSHDNHVVVILGCGADERDAADIDFLDDIGIRSSGSHSGGERIEVDDHKVDRRYLVRESLFLVRFIVAAIEDAAEHLRVQRLYTAAENRRIAGEVLYGFTFIAERFDKGAGAACRQELNALFIKHFENLVESVLMEYGNQCSGNFLSFFHRFGYVLGF